MTPTDDIEVIEFHDAVVERVELTRNGNVRVELSHLPVYRRETVDSLGIWSYRAELRLVGTASFAGSGSPPRDEADAIAEAVLLGVDERAIDLVHLARGGTAALGSLELTWLLCGARFVFRGGHVSLVLLRAMERVETWEGALLDG